MGKIITGGVPRQAQPIRWPVDPKPNSCALVATRSDRGLTRATDAAPQLYREVGIQSADEYTASLRRTEMTMAFVGGVISGIAALFAGILAAIIW